MLLQRLAPAVRAVSTKGVRAVRAAHAAVVGVGANRGVPRAEQVGWAVDGKGVAIAGCCTDWVEWEVH